VPSCHWCVAIDYMIHSVIYVRALTNCIWYRQAVRTMNSILRGSTLCPTSDVSPTVTDIVQTLADVTLLGTVRRSGASRMLCKSELCIHVVNCTRIYREYRWSTKPAHWNVTGSRMTARCLCYRPAVFFRHLHVIRLSCREENLSVLLQSVIIQNIFTFQYCVRLKLRK